MKKPKLLNIHSLPRYCSLGLQNKPLNRNGRVTSESLIPCLKRVVDITQADYDRFMNAK
jgi:hypothetical protein